MSKLTTVIALLAFSATADAQTAFSTWNIADGAKTTSIYMETDHEGFESIERSVTCIKSTKRIEIRSYPAESTFMFADGGGRSVNGCDTVCKYINASAFKSNAKDNEPKSMRIEHAPWLSVKSRLASLMQDGYHFHELDRQQQKDEIARNMQLLSDFSSKCGLK